MKIYLKIVMASLGLFPGLLFSQNCTPKLFGVNLAGAEFGESALPGQHGVNYIYPTANYEYKYFAGNKLELIRLPIRWERVQAQAFGSLTTFDIGKIREALNVAQNNGAKIILELHNYGRYYHTALVTADSSKLADVWRKLAMEFASHPALYGYEIMNEPNNMPGGATSWRWLAQAALNAIRKVDTKNMILIPGYDWQSADRWPNSSDVLKYITDATDPSKSKLIFAAHQYFDDNASGKYSSPCSDTTIGVKRVNNFINWLTTNNLKGMITEYGIPDQACWRNTLNYFMTRLYNSNRILGGTYWAAGPWWTTYSLSVEPNSDGSNSHSQALVLKKYPSVVCNSCTNKPVTGVSLNKASTSIQLCTKEQLNATPAPADACDKSLIWTSDNAAIATVNASGVVTGVSTGTANITVKTNSGGFTKTCAVTVTDVQAAYNNISRTIPGRIQAEDYDTGGECIAFHDTDTGNNGGQYRINEAVDIKTTVDVMGGGYDVGWGAGGEWIEYTVDATAGVYDVNLRAGSANAGNQLTVKLDGVTLGTVSVPNMGNWNDKSTQTISAVSIPGGNKKILRIEIIGNGVDINWVEFTGTTTGISSAEISPGISVYPNPTTGVFTISYPCRDCRNTGISITDVLGRTILSKQYETSGVKDELDISGVPDGIYVIRVCEGDHVKTMKLMKQ